MTIPFCLLVPLWSGERRSWARQLQPSWKRLKCNKGRQMEWSVHTVCVAVATQRPEKENIWFNVGSLSHSNCSFTENSSTGQILIKTKWGKITD